MSKLTRLEKMLGRRIDRAERLKAEGESLKAETLRLAREVSAERSRLADEARKKAEPGKVVAGTRVAKVWPVGVVEADEVVLHRWSSCGGIVYGYVHKTGDPEKDRWRGEGCDDHTNPTFIKTEAIYKWNRLARQMNKLLAESRVELEGGRK